VRPTPIGSRRAPGDRPGFRTSLDAHVRAPRAEAALPVPRWTPITDPTSLRVEEMYTSAPYPRWHHLGPTASDTVAGYLRARTGAPAPASLEDLDAPRVLVAGCGTGRHALQVARRLERARVEAIDLSRASLAFAIRRARELGEARVTFAQADLLALDRGTYDLVECVGVLHHLEDPAAGWRAVRRLLAPGGLLRAAVYTAKARTGIARARDEIARRGLTARDIPRFRALLVEHAQEWSVPEIPRMIDFYTRPGCRDLLFHVSEHRHPLRQISADVAAAGLRVIGVESPDDASLARYRAAGDATPGAPDLLRWAEIETPETFRRMLTLWATAR